MEREIIMNAEVDTGYGIGFFPVPVKLKVDENANIKEWAWENEMQDGTKLWWTPDEEARLRVLKKDILYQMNVYQNQ